MKDDILAAHLEVWFENNAHKINIWNQTKTGKLLKEKLKQLDHWKNKKRGIHAKGEKKIKKLDSKKIAQNFFG
jgi:hypothetical protein